MTDLQLRCRCGAVRGTVSDVSPATSNRVVCYCGDCRAFIRYLGRDDLLDAHGGTDVVQFWPSRVRFTAGAEQLRAMRLSEKGMLRCYTACCRTPAGNVVSAGMPFVGLPGAMLEEDLKAQGLDASALAPAVGVQGKSGFPTPSPTAHASAPLSLIARIVWFLGRAVLTGKGRPTPYFDDAGAPRVRPEVLSAEARAALRDP